MKAMDDLGIEVFLGERLDLSSVKPESKEYNDLGQRVVRTEKGRSLAADLMVRADRQFFSTHTISTYSLLSASVHWPGP